MKYDKELTDLLEKLYLAEVSVPEIAVQLSAKVGEAVPERSIIAKLSSMGIYKKKAYLTKRGEVPVKKGEYIERIAVLLDVSADLLESLEKVNKNILALLAQKLPAP
jgi:hypothetical protein